MPCFSEDWYLDSPLIAKGVTIFVTMGTDHLKGSWALTWEAVIIVDLELVK